MRNRTCRLLAALLSAAGLGVALLGTVSAGVGQAATACRPFSLGNQEPYSLLPFTVASATGILKKNNLCAPQLVQFTTLPAMTAALANNQITAALQTPILVVNYNRATSGSPMQFFAPGQTFNLVWTERKGDGIPVATAKNWRSTVLGWRGKKIGVPAIGGVIDLATRYLATQVGLTPNTDFQIVATGAGATEIAALQSGAVDVVSGDDYGASSLTVPGIGVNILDTGAGQGPAIFKGAFESGYLAQESTIGSNIPLYMSIATALAQAQAYMRNPKNKQNVVLILAADVGVTRQVAASLYGTIKSFQAQLTAKSWAQTSTAFLGANLITPPAPSFASIIAKL